MSRAALLKTMQRRCRQEIVVSEPDLQAVLEHLRALPHRPSLPASWDRQRLLSRLREVLGERPMLGQCYEAAPGVFAIVKPFGVDLAQGAREPADEHESRLQVWLAIRHCGTDPTRTTRL